MGVAEKRSRAPASQRAAWLFLNPANAIRSIRLRFR
jgi:hypothetical protein